MRLIISVLLLCAFAAQSVARGMHNWTVRKASPWRLVPVYLRVELGRVG